MTKPTQFEAFTKALLEAIPRTRGGIIHANYAEGRPPFIDMNAELDGHVFKVTVVCREMNPSELEVSDA